MDFNFDDLSEDVQEYITKLEDLALDLKDQVELLSKESDDSDEEEVEEVSELLKSADPSVVHLVKSLQEQVDAAEEIAKAERDARLEREFIEKAAGFTNLPAKTEEFGRLLKALAESLDEETFARAVDIYGAADAAIGKAAPWAELGSTIAPESGAGKLDELTKAYQGDHPDVTYEQAMDAVLVQNPGLYTEYLREQGV